MKLRDLSDLGLNINRAQRLSLGSGLGELARSVADPIVIPYEAIPDWPVSTVIGHKGSLVIGKMEGQECAGDAGESALL